MRKCPHCKECLDLYFYKGARLYRCVLCNKYFKLVLGKGLVETEKSDVWKGL